MARHKKTIDEKERQPFATRIRTLIDADPQITQADVAAAIGKSRQVVSQYCHGDSEPAYDTLVKIAAFFGVTVDYLLGVTETKSTRPDLQAAVQLSGISEENMVFLESCVRDQSADVTPFLLSQDALAMVNELIGMVRSDTGMLARYAHLASWDTDDDMQQLGITLCHDIVKLSALDVGRAIEKHLLEQHWEGMSDYGND